MLPNSRVVPASSLRLMASAFFTVGRSSPLHSISTLALLLSLPSVNTIPSSVMACRVMPRTSTGRRTAYRPIAGHTPFQRQCGHEYDGEPGSRLLWA